MNLTRTEKKKKDFNSMRGKGKTFLRKIDCSIDLVYFPAPLNATQPPAKIVSKCILKPVVLGNPNFLNVYFFSHLK